MICRHEFLLKYLMGKEIIMRNSSHSWEAKRILICISVIVLSVFASCDTERISFETTWLKLGLSGKGYVTTIYDKIKSVEYLPPGQSAPLVSLYRQELYITPSGADYDEAEHAITLNYPNGSVALVRADDKGEYLRFELLSLEPRNGTEAIVWGPYATSIDDKIGETICVVRNGEFSFGLQSLDINTTEGLPDGDDSSGGGAFIEPLPGQVLPDSLKDKIGQRVEINVNETGDIPEYVRIYRGSAAVRRSFGSELRLFSRDRTSPRVIGNWLGNKDYRQYAEPVDADFTGSAIAMFGCPAHRTLDFIEKIEMGEGLPHPLLDGVWIKRSTIPGEAYLLNEGDPVKSLRYARECGFSLVHIGDIFKNWGHFEYSEKRFPGGLAEIVKATGKARGEGISLGIHTLGLFTTSNDPYITPVPSDSLCKTGSSELTRDAGKNDEVIFIGDPAFFRYTGITHTAKMGKELLNYAKVSDDEPWRLIDCRRGQFGTEAREHSRGEKIDKLTNNSYSGFYPDIHLQDSYAVRLAQVCNETGAGLMDFDGFAGESPTGHGSYGAARFIDTWYRNTRRSVLVCGAGTFHYYWHIYSFMNWGEPWYNALRESQVNYRIENQRYFERNLMPGMLGWFTLGPGFRTEEIEWIQARSAGFNAGYLIRIDENVEKNGYRDQMFEAIREWQKARKLDIFTEEQKELLKDPRKEFHLEKTGEDEWNLYPVSLQRGFTHKYREAQTGDKPVSKFVITNPYFGQPLQFYLTATGSGDGSPCVSGIKLMIDGYPELAIDAEIHPGRRLVCDGRSVYLCDGSWKRIREIKCGKIPVLKKGDSEITLASQFSGPDAPELEIEFKTTGSPEKIKL